LELSYTSHDVEPFARDHGDTGALVPVGRAAEVRHQGRAGCRHFHLYGLRRDDVDYVRDTFRAFRNNDPDRFARTKAILTAYDAMAPAIPEAGPVSALLPLEGELWSRVHCQANPYVRLPFQERQQVVDVLREEIRRLPLAAPQKRCAVR
jgi:Lhr-like helicase